MPSLSCQCFPFHASCICSHQQERGRGGLRERWAMMGGGRGRWWWWSDICSYALCILGRLGHKPIAERPHDDRLDGSGRLTTSFVLFSVSLSPIGAVGGGRAVQHLSSNRKAEKSDFFFLSPFSFSLWVFQMHFRIFAFPHHHRHPPPPTSPSPLPANSTSSLSSSGDGIRVFMGWRGGWRLRWWWLHLSTAFLWGPRRLID